MFFSDSLSTESLVSVRHSQEHPGWASSQWMSSEYVYVGLMYCVSESTLLCHDNKCLTDYRLLYVDGSVK